MLLEITTTHQPATDLGFLLHKHPDKVATRSLSCGEAVVFYSEVSPERCTAVLVGVVDPVALVRGRSEASSGMLEAYVNDRAYVGSSFLASAIVEMYSTAINGRSKDRQELAETAIPLRAHIPAINCGGGAELVERLFGPLGYAIEVTTLEQDELPGVGESRLLGLTLSGTVRLCDLLRHLYILLPVLDGSHHFWIGDSEVDKLVAKGEEWIPSHPARTLILARYLKRSRTLLEQAMTRLAPEPVAGAVGDASAAEEAAPTAPVAGAEEVRAPKLKLNDVRLDAVASAILERRPSRVIDIGCGEGKLMQRLWREAHMTAVAGTDVSLRALEIASQRLKLDSAPDHLRQKITLFQGSLLYVDKRFEGYDAAAVVEVIEHLEPQRLEAMERVLFEKARPVRVVLTTPNADHNVRWEALAEPGTMRHSDHRFEWTRQQFADWATAQATRFGYRVEFRPVGPVDEEVGPPTQMAVFDRLDTVGGVEP